MKRIDISPYTSWPYPDYQATDGLLSNPLMMWLPPDTNTCTKDLKRTTGETIVVPRTYSDNIYTLWTKSNHRTVRTTRSVFRSTCSKDPHPRNHLCNIVCSLLMICYVLNTCYLTAWWSRNNQKFGRVYRLDRPRTLSLKPGRGWMWGIIFRRIGILETCGKGQHVRGNLTDSNWWMSVWNIVEFISKTNADMVNHHIVKNETRNGWTCRDHAGTA